MSESSDHDGRCADCGAEPPITDTEYTLISSQHGWRCTKVVNEKGHPIDRLAVPQVLGQAPRARPVGHAKIEGCALTLLAGQA